jgi:hypothetical protein
MLFTNGWPISYKHAYRHSGRENAQMITHTKYDAVTGLLSRHGHMIGRAVPTIKTPPFGAAGVFYEIIDCENRSYGFASDSAGGPSFFASFLMSIVECAAAIPNYPDQHDADGQMLTMAKQRRDIAAFQVKLCRDQWAKMRTAHRKGRPASAQSRSALFQTYRQAQADFRRFSARVEDQSAADNCAMIGIVETNRLMDQVFGGFGR